MVTTEMPQNLSRTERSARAWQNPNYSQEQIARLSEVFRELMATGHEHEALTLELRMAENHDYADLPIPELSEAQKKKGALRPETNISVELVDIPPTSGKGSSQKAWVEFALLVSDIDEEVLEQLSRDEIVEVLIDRDIIDDPKSAD